LERETRAAHARKASDFMGSSGRPPSGAAGRARTMERVRPLCMCNIAHQRWFILARPRCSSFNPPTASRF